MFNLWELLEFTGMVDYCMEDWRLEIAGDCLKVLENTGQKERCIQ